MNNSNQKLYIIYKNIQSFYSYRGLVSLDEELEQDAFVQQIQQDKYVLLSAVDKRVVSDQMKINEVKALVRSLNEMSDTRDITLTHIPLIYEKTECESKRMNMMKFINHVRFPSAKIMIVTPSKISTSVAKGLQALREKREHRNHEFKWFTYTLFNCILPEHELVPRYEILSEDKVEKLREQYIDPETLPKIFENDPPMVWIGANVGDVVKVICLSEVTIQAISYVKVIPNPQ